MDKLKQLTTMLELLKENTISPKQLADVIATLVKNVNQAKADLNDVNRETLSENLKETKDVLQKAVTYLEEGQIKLKNDIQTTLKGETSKLQSDTKDVLKKALDALEKIEQIQVVDGKDADEDVIVGKVLEKIVLPEYKETVLDTGEEIATKLELLKDDARLDFSALKNVPEVNSKANGGGFRNLHQMHDVNIDTPTNNQVLKYNSTTSQWENGTVSSGASTLAAVSTGSITTPNSLYTMTSTIPVEFRRSGGDTQFYMNESTGNSFFGTSATATLATVGIKGAGATSSTNAFYAENSAGTEIFRIDNFGNIKLKNTISTNFYDANNNRIFINQILATGNNSGLFLHGNNSISWSNTTGIGNINLGFSNSEVNVTSTSGSTMGVLTRYTFNPTSGTAVFNTTEIRPTINQTGGANGITRGVFINPTLTAAADFRALEITLGKVIIPTETPASASATGVTGQVAWDANYIYICTATNTWKRVAIVTW